MKVRFLIPAILSMVAFAAIQARAVEVSVGAAPVERPVLQSGTIAQAPNAAVVVNDRPDSWRYKWENNRWWYWTPENRWMWYGEPGGWTYYTPSGSYTTGYGGVAVTPEYSTPVYSAPVYAAPAPTYYYPSYGYYPGYYGGYYGGPGVYIGGRGFGVGVGWGRRR